MSVVDPIGESPPDVGVFTKVSDLSVFSGSQSTWFGITFALQCTSRSLKADLCACFQTMKGVVSASRYPLYKNPSFPR